MLWIAQWPQTLTYPGFLAPLLLTSGIQRTLALTYRPVRADIATRELRRRKTGHLSDATQRARMGQTTDATDQAELADVLQQEADLAAGHSLLTATARSPSAPPASTSSSTTSPPSNRLRSKPPWRPEDCGDSGHRRSHALSYPAEPTATPTTS